MRGARPSKPNGRSNSAFEAEVRRLIAQITGGITGSGASGQVSIWSGSASLTGSTKLTANSTSGDLTSQGTVAGARLQITDIANPSIFDPSGRTRIAFTDRSVEYWGTAQSVSDTAHVFAASSEPVGKETIFIGISTSGGSNPFGIDYNGKLHFFSTDSTGSPGNASISKVAGKSAIAAGATSIVITNGLVTASSEVFITLLSIDAPSKWSAVPAIGGGSFTVTVDAAPAAAWAFSWWVLN